MQEERIPWGEIQFTDTLFSFELAEGHTLEVVKNSREILIRISVNGNEEAHRFVIGSDTPVYMEPGLPDLPILIKPVDTITILPAMKFNAFLEIPFSIKFLFGPEQKKTLLFEYRPSDISRCYVDGPEKGEFAYHMESRVFPRISDYERPHISVYCPLVVINKSSASLAFDRLVFRTANLSIFHSPTVLIASPVHITFKGQDQVSQVVYRKSPADPENELKLVSLSKKAEPQSILKRSFYYIKNLYSG